MDMTDRLKIKLEIPSCSECEKIGIEMPDLYNRMERDLGADALRAFLSSYGGQQFAVPVKPSNDAAPEWLRRNLGFGNITLPLGPVGVNARIAWAIYELLKSGASIAKCANATGCHERTVSEHKARLQCMGLSEYWTKRLSGIGVRLGETGGSPRCG